MLRYFSALQCSWPPPRGMGPPPPPRVRFRLLGLEKPRCRTAISTAQELIAREQMLELIFSSCLHTTLLP